MSIIKRSTTVFVYCSLLAAVSGQGSTNISVQTSLSLSSLSVNGDDNHGYVPSDIRRAAPLFGSTLWMKTMSGALLEWRSFKPSKTVLDDQNVGEVGSKLQPRIVGGEAADDGEFPFFAHMLGDAVCGGSLIAPNIVLTAAHCNWDRLAFVAVGADEYNVQIGVEQGNAEHIQIEAAVVHPSYNQASFSDSDFMILKLTGDVTNAQIVKLERSFTLPDGGLKMIGVGRTDQFDPSTSGSDLKELAKVEIPYETCRLTFPGLINQASMICAGPPGLDGGNGPCLGDSGGPLFYYDEDGDPVQVGVASFGGAVCAAEDMPTIYARVSYALPWIQAVACGEFGSTYAPLCADYVPQTSQQPSSCDDTTETIFQFMLQADDNGADYSWELKNVDSGEVVSSDGGFSNGELRLYDGCLSNDVNCWSLTITDVGSSPGFCCDGVGEDGLCCGGQAAGFGVVFGSESVVLLQNPVFQEWPVVVSMCQEPPVSSETKAVGSETCTDVKIRLRTDERPEETLLVLLGDDFETILYPSDFLGVGREVEIESCVDGCSRLIILDEGEDGIAPPGGLNVSIGGEQVITDLLNFEAGSVVEFGTGCPVPSDLDVSACKIFEMFVRTDDFAEETSLFVLSGDKYEVLFHRQNDLEDNKLYNYTDCLAGCVTVGVYDAGGDGFQFPGFFNVSFGGDTIKDMSDIGKGGVFRVGAGCLGDATESSLSQVVDNTAGAKTVDSAILLNLLTVGAFLTMIA